MCRVHTPDFSTLNIHKICLDKWIIAASYIYWIYFKFVCMLRASFPLLLLQISSLHLTSTRSNHALNENNRMCKLCHRLSMTMHILFGHVSKKYYQQEIKYTTWLVS